MKIKKSKKFTKIYSELFNKELKINESLILCLLVSYSNSNKKIFITNNGIMKYFNESISISTINRTIKILVELGYITKSTCKHNYEETGKWYNQRIIEVTDKTFNLIKGELANEELVQVEPIKESEQVPVEEVIETPTEEESIQPEASASVVVDEVLETNESKTLDELYGLSKKETAPVAEEVIPESVVATVIEDEDLINVKEVLELVHTDGDLLYDYLRRIQKIPEKMNADDLVAFLQKNKWGIQSQKFAPTRAKQLTEMINKIVDKYLSHRLIRTD